MRAVLALILVAAAGAGAAFFADHPGRVEIVWQGWQVDTSVGVLVGAVALVVLVVSGLALCAAALYRWPQNLRRRRAARRRRAGEAALTGGLVALAAGHPAEAQRAARRAETLLAEAPFGGAIRGAVWGHADPLLARRRRQRSTRATRRRRGAPTRHCSIGRRPNSSVCAA